MSAFCHLTNDIPKVLLCHLTNDIPKVSPHHLASNPDQYQWWGWRLHKGGACSIASNQPLRLYVIQWRSRNDNLIPWQVDETQVVPTAGNIFRLHRQWGVECVDGRVRRIRWNRGSKWEPDWVRHCGGGQDNQGEVLDNYCHVTSTLGALRSGFEGHVITIILLEKILIGFFYNKYFIK